MLWARLSAHAPGITEKLPGGRGGGGVTAPRYLWTGNVGDGEGDYTALKAFEGWDGKRPRRLC